MATAKLTIDCEGGTTTGARVLLDDVDISNVLSRLKLNMAVGEVNTAELTVMVGPVELRGDVHTIVRDKLASFYKDKSGTWHEGDEYVSTPEGDILDSGRGK
jgi:hypothetical protein